MPALSECELGRERLLGEACATGSDVRVDGLVTGSECANHPVIEVHRAVTVLSDRSEVVTDEDDRAALCFDALECPEALSLKTLVTDREDLVEQEDVEGNLDRDRVG